MTILSSSELNGILNIKEIINNFLVKFKYFKGITNFKWMNFNSVSELKFFCQNLFYSSSIPLKLFLLSSVRIF